MKKPTKKSKLINLGAKSDEVSLEKGIYDITDSPMAFSKKKGKKKKIWGEYASWMDLGLGPKGIKMKDVPGWNKIKAFKEWLEFNNENEVNEARGEFVYHVTHRKFLDNIARKGLLPNQPPMFSRQSSGYVREVYGMIPIFVSLDKPLYGIGDRNFVVLKIYVNGIPLVADIPSLIDRGAHLEENGIWFDDNKRQFGLKETEDDDLIYYEDLLDPTTRDCMRSISLTGTAAIMQPIEPRRIRLFKGGGSPPGMVMMM
jgi:hypothetical protein